MESGENRFSGSTITGSFTQENLTQQKCENLFGVLPLLAGIRLAGKRLGYIDILRGAGERSFVKPLPKRVVKAMAKTIAKGKRVVLKISPGSCSLGTDDITQIGDIHILNVETTG